MIQTFLIASLFLAPPHSFAADDWFAEVHELHGDVKLDGKSLKHDEKISKEGVLVSNETGSLQMTFRNKDGVLKLGPNSTLSIIRPNPASTDAYELTKGSCRWKIKPLASGTKWIRVRTNAATMGVRGTDFMATANPLLGETELVVFDGKVEFGSTTSEADKKIVTKGQWGGIGGRFGNRISNLLNLSDEVLNTLRKPVEIVDSAAQ